ncbi:TIGR02611 family protein [Tsukamurella sp. 8F]|uniref:TIGR02611 family protein n=1 Tax=unclassified Tsukamurella TaxID=2633480 RepID=UPI0023B9E6C1|nr:MULTISPECIES: TIGR02611 family protein [unclassified Tsukamurella]MDF0531387.1 TIGR02611 family protein [Tsukamurella sp. 8J]MDF0585307.1 TIGR02611 family protein [Tsukamurella sp. 8F]
MRGVRDRVRARPGGTRLWRIGVGVVGTAVLVVGIIAIPYPGPGWLVVFAGLGILASEFEWAKRVLRFAHRYYDAFTAWLGRQNILVKGLFGLFTCAIVIATLWVLGAIGTVAGWVGLDQPWLQSPLKQWA